MVRKRRRADRKSKYEDRPVKKIRRLIEHDDEDGEYDNEEAAMVTADNRDFENLGGGSAREASGDSGIDSRSEDGNDDSQPQLRPATGGKTIPTSWGDAYVPVPEKQGERLGNEDLTNLSTSSSEEDRLGAEQPHVPYLTLDQLFLAHDIARILKIPLFRLQDYVPPHKQRRYAIPGGLSYRSSQLLEPLAFADDHWRDRWFAPSASTHWLDVGSSDHWFLETFLPLVGPPISPLTPPPPSSSSSVKAFNQEPALDITHGHVIYEPGNKAVERRESTDSPKASEASKVDDYTPSSGSESEWQESNGSSTLSMLGRRPKGRRPLSRKLDQAVRTLLNSEPSFNGESSDEMDSEDEVPRSKTGKVKTIHERKRRISLKTSSSDDEPLKKRVQRIRRSACERKILATQDPSSDDGLLKLSTLTRHRIKRVESSSAEASQKRERPRPEGVTQYRYEKKKGEHDQAKAEDSNQVPDEETHERIQEARRGRYLIIGGQHPDGSSRSPRWVQSKLVSRELVEQWDSQSG